MAMLISSGPYSALALYSALRSRLRRLPRTSTRSSLSRLVGRASARNAVVRMWLSRHPDAHRVDRRAGGEEQRLEIGAAEGEVGRHLGSADDAEPGPIGGEDPRAARARAVDPAFHVHLHAVGHAIRLVGGHVGEDAPAHHLAGGIQLEHMDV